MKNSRQKTLRVKDLIAYLKTLPQNMEVFRYWDEGGTYCPVKSGVQAATTSRIAFRKNKFSSGSNWRDVADTEAGKEVCAI